MALNFGGSKLFNTDIEERWKGVFSERIERIPSAEVSQTSQYGPVGTSWEDVGDSFTIDVYPDEKVVIFLSAVVEPTTSTGTSDYVSFRITKDGSSYSIFNTVQQVSDGSSTFRVASAFPMLADPGEGRHTFQAQAQSGDGTSTIYNLQVVGFVITVK